MEPLVGDVLAHRQDTGHAPVIVQHRTEANPEVLATDGAGEVQVDRHPAESRAVMRPEPLPHFWGITSSSRVPGTVLGSYPLAPSCSPVASSTRSSLSTMMMAWSGMLSTSRR